MFVVVLVVSLNGWLLLQASGPHKESLNSVRMSLEIANLENMSNVESVRFCPIR